MIRLLFEFFIFGGLAIVFSWTAWLRMPNAIDKKTKRKRSLYQRWKLANRSLRAELILGVAAGIVSLLAALQLLHLIPPIEG